MAHYLKPPLPVIDWNNQLSQNLVFEAPMMESGGTNIVNIVDRQANPLAFTNSPTWGLCLFGSGVTFLATSQQYASTSTPISTVRDNFTMQVVGYFRALTVADGTEQILFYNGRDNSGYGIGIQGRNIEVLFGGIARITTGAAGDLPTTANVNYNIIFRRQAGTTRVWNNGKDLGVSSVSVPNVPAVKTSIGCEFNSSSVAFRFTDGTIALCRLWERPLSENEIRTIGNDPWYLYKRRDPSRVQADTTTLQTATGVARIQKAISQTTTGKARVEKSATQTATGVARIQKAVLQTITGLARVTASTLRTITGLSRIQNSGTQTTTGKARIQKAATQTATGVSRIQKAATQTVTGLARLAKNATQTITGKSRVTNSSTQTVTGKAAIQKQTTKTITGRGSIGTLSTKNITGSANIILPVWQQSNRTTWYSKLTNNWFNRATPTWFKRSRSL